MHTNINRSVKHALLLNQGDLKEFWDLIEANYGEIKASLSCVDGSELHTSSFFELDAFENPSFRKINKLNFRCGCFDESVCVVTLGDHGFATASLTIGNDPDDKRALKVADEFGKRVRECRPFYWWLRFIKPTLAIWLMFFLWASAQVWSAFISSGGKLPANDVSIVTMFYIAVPFAGLYFVVGAYLDRSWNWMFPLVWFNLGRQVAELERRLKVRYWVFGVIILSIVLSVIGNIISNVIMARP